MSITCGRNACAVNTTRDRAGYSFPATVKALVARWTVMPVSNSAVANFAAGAIAGVNPMALGPYAVKLAIGGFILPFYFLFNPGLNMQGGAVNVASAILFGTAMVTFASFALHGMAGKRTIEWPLRLALAACTVAAIVPRIEYQIAATLVGTLILASRR